MSSGPVVEPLDFGRVRFDPTRRELAIDGVPAKLGARAFDLLAALIEGRDRVVPKVAKALVPCAARPGCRVVA